MKNNILRFIKLFFSPNEFWAVYAFCIYSFLYGFLNQGGFDEPFTSQPMIITPLGDYFITTASLTCMLLWFYTVINFVQKLIINDRVASAAHITHIFLMFYYADFFSLHGMILIWGLR